MYKKGLFLIFSTAIISGFSVFINKYGVSVISPYVFTFLKNALVALMLCSIFLAIKERRALKNISKKQWATLILIGLVGGSAPFLLFFRGLALTSAAQGAFIHKTMFIYVMVLAAIFLKEKISKEFLIGALLLILGNLLLLKKLPVSFGKGDLLVIVATFLWAIENVISKYALRDLSGKVVAWGRMFFGSIFILGYLGFLGQLAPIANLNLQQAGWTVIVAGLLFGYVLTWYSGLKYVPVSVAAAILMLGSSVTTMLSLASGASVTPKEIMASGLILSGLIFAVGFRYLLEWIKYVSKIYERS